MKKQTKNVKKYIKESRDKARERVAEVLVNNLHCAKLVVPYREFNKGVMYASVELKDILKAIKFSDKI